MQIAFYRGDTSWFSRLIAWWTGTVALEDGQVVGPFVHCELIFSDGTWFSSDERHGGTRFEVFRCDPADPRWLFVDLPLSKDAEYIVRCRAIAINHLGYDYWGIWKTAWRPTKESPDRWFCSEACLHCLQGANIFHGTPPWRVTPVDLAALVLSVFGKAGEAK